MDGNTTRRINFMAKVNDSPAGRQSKLLTTFIETNQNQIDPQASEMPRCKDQQGTNY
jgi:hypothetical protein